MIYQNDTELAAGLLYWQTILRLNHWNIKAELCRRWDMTGTTNLASVHRNFEKRYAHIKLIHPLDIEPDWDHEDSDLENSLVHELLHIHVGELLNLASSDDPDAVAVDREEERLIEVLGPALVALNRRPSAYPFVDPLAL